MGVGTTGPQTPLHVTAGEGGPGTGNAAYGLIVTAGASNRAVNIGTNSTSGWIQSAYTNNIGVGNYLALNPNGGNVGVGLSNPGYPLVVYGANTAYQFTISSYNSSLDFNCGTRFGTLSPGFTTIDPNGGSPQGLGIWDHLAINGTCAIGSAYAQTTPSPANSLIVSGSVGIGTAAPIRSLHLIGEYSQTPGAGTTCYYNVSDSAGSNGGNYTLMLRGLGTSGSAQVNMSAFSVQATSSSFNGTISGTNIYASGSFVLNGSGGAYQAGSIYSDSNWGMILRAYQASPALAQFLFVNSAGTEQCRITTTGGFTSINDITAYSDIRHKTNIKKIENPLDKVLAMNGYTFNRTDCEEDKDRRYVGVVAQEVLEVLPEVVHMKEDGMYSVAYGNITALLIEALKEERAERLKLEKRLERLEKLLFKE